MSVFIYVRTLVSIHVSACVHLPAHKYMRVHTCPHIGMYARERMCVRMCFSRTCWRACVSRVRRGTESGPTISPKRTCLHRSLRDHNLAPLKIPAVARIPTTSRMHLEEFRVPFKNDRRCQFPSSLPDSLSRPLEGGMCNDDKSARTPGRISSSVFFFHALFDRICRTFEPYYETLGYPCIEDGEDVPRDRASVYINTAVLCAPRAAPYPKTSWRHPDWTHATFALRVIAPAALLQTRVSGGTRGPAIKDFCRRVRVRSSS